MNSNPVVVRAVKSDIQEMRRRAKFLTSAIANICMVEPSETPVYDVIEQILAKELKDAYVAGATAPRENFWEEHTVIDAEFVEIVETEK